MLQLMEHQKELVEIARDEPRYGVFWEPGVGKTIALLAVISDQKARGFVGKTIVVAPKSILWSAWLRDAIHFPDLKVVVCWADNPAKRRKLLQTPDADVIICNYETFKMFYRPENRRKGIPDGIEHDLLTPLGVRRLIIDESSKIRNYDSQISHAAYGFSLKVPSVYLLSGTPAPNGYINWFGQIRCINPALFGRSFWAFANSYGGPVKRFIAGREVTIGWKIHRINEANLLAKINSCSTTRRACDCLDLPAENDEIRNVDLSPPELNAYVSILQQLVHEFDDGEITQVTANAKSMKLRQITGGNLYIADGGVREVGDSKLSAMMELLEELGDRPVVIWAEFTAEIERIARTIHKTYGMERAVQIIDGSVGAELRARHIADFQAGNLKYLVCHPAAAGHGITLTAARFDIFYSLGFFPENHLQARARIYRNTQHWPVTHFYLISRNTVDERTLKVLKGKSSAAEEVKKLLVEAQRLQMAEAG